MQSTVTASAEAAQEVTLAASDGRVAAVIGLGYVSLPLPIASTEAGLAPRSETAREHQVFLRGARLRTATSHSDTGSEW